MSIENTLAERGNRYGDFTDHADLAQGIQFRMQKFCLKADNDVGFIEPWKDRLNNVQRQALTVISDKIARILSGDPNYADNWHDIQGYAKLVEDRLPTRPTAPALPPAPSRQPVAAAPRCTCDSTVPGEHDPWYGAPEWAEYKAQDEDGEWRWYSHLPEAGEERWHDVAMHGRAAHAHEDHPNPNWRDTLISR